MIEQDGFHLCPNGRRFQDLRKRIFQRGGGREHQEGLSLSHI